MARRYVMTPGRRVALRKAQLASAKKRRRTSSKSVAHIKRNRKKYIAGGLAVGVIGGAVAQDQVRNVRLYHNTDKRYAKSIKANGLHGVKVGSFSHVRFKETPGQVFVTKGRNTSKMFGDTVVKVKMNRKEFNRYSTFDQKMAKNTRRAYSINESHLKGKKMTVKRAGKRQEMQYLAAFPTRTKESFAAFEYSNNLKALKRQRRATQRSSVKRIVRRR